MRGFSFLGHMLPMWEDLRRLGVALSLLRFGPYNLERNILIFDNSIEDHSLALDNVKT